MKPNTPKESPKKRLADYLKKVKQQRPAISGSAPSGKINKTDRGLKDD